MALSVNSSGDAYLGLCLAALRNLNREKSEFEVDRDVLALRQLKELTRRTYSACTVGFVKHASYRGQRSEFIPEQFEISSFEAYQSQDRAISEELEFLAGKTTSLVGKETHTAALDVCRNSRLIVCDSYCLLLIDLDRPSVLACLKKARISLSNFLSEFDLITSNRRDSQVSGRIHLYLQNIQSRIGIIDKLLAYVAASRTGKEMVGRERQDVLKLFVNESLSDLESSFGFLTCSVERFVKRTRRMKNSCERLNELLFTSRQGS